jgi:hypothetical protein
LAMLVWIAVLNYLQPIFNFGRTNPFQGPVSP